MTKVNDNSNISLRIEGISVPLNLPPLQNKQREKPLKAHNLTKANSKKNFNPSEVTLK